jgi:hypothetical protein
MPWTAPEKISALLAAFQVPRTDVARGLTKVFFRPSNWLEILMEFEGRKFDSTQKQRILQWRKDKVWADLRSFFVVSACCVFFIIFVNKIKVVAQKINEKRSRAQLETYLASLHVLAATVGRAYAHSKVALKQQHETKRAAQEKDIENADEKEDNSESTECSSRSSGSRSSSSESTQVLLVFFSVFSFFF